MELPLLTTKLCVPPIRTALVPRPALVDRLNAGLWQSGPPEARTFVRKLTLISAPAGFGKTTLVCEWLQHLCTASPHPPAVAWLSLDGEDNAPVRFLTYLVAAVESAQEGAGAEARALLQAPQPLSIRAVLTVLIHRLAGSPSSAVDPMVLVLDDYHVIERQPVHTAVTFFLDHLPPRVHLVIAGRSEPPFPLARLRARRDLVAFRAADLRFTVDQADVFFNQVMALNLTPANVAALEACTEGWIAGLQMAALSVQGRTATHAADFIAAFGGSHRHVIDYLGEEVLARQPDHVRRFLCQTAILDRLTGPLCDAVSGRSDSEALLQQLEEANLFVLPLDDERRWYRYHGLFADVLRHTLAREMPDRVHDLHCWAAEWYEGQGLVAEAIGHTLQAEAYEWAAHLIAQPAMSLLMRTEVTTLLGWLEALPEALVRAQPNLCVLYAEALLVAGSLGPAEDYLALANRALGAGEYDGSAGQMRSHILASYAYVAMYRGELRRAAALAYEAQALLTEEAPALRVMLTWLSGFTRFFDQDTEQAKQTMIETFEAACAYDNPLMVVLSVYVLANLYTLQGHLREARAAIEKALDIVQPVDPSPGTDSHTGPFPGIGLLYQGLGEVMRQANQLDAAQRALAQGIALCEQWGNAEVLVDTYVVLARTRQAMGDAAGAREAIGRAVRLLQTHDLADLTVRQIEAYQARLWVVQGNLHAAADWVDRQQARRVDGAPDDGHMALLIRWLEQGTVARCYLATQRFAEAQKTLAPLLDATEASGWMGCALDVLALQALAYQGQGDVDRAFAALGQALSLAQPERYDRVFLDEAGPMADLLSAFCRAGRADGAVQRYADALLSAFEAEAPGEVDDTPSRVSSHEGLVEPLSEREQEVLRLVAEGLSNREIAERLYVAVSTVKTHINNLYRKLDVSRRTQAIARAHTLGLL